MGLCKKCGTWHGSKECPPLKLAECSCGNSFKIPWDATGMLELITCGKCGKKMADAKITDAEI